VFEIDQGKLGLSLICGHYIEQAFLFESG